MILPTDSFTRLRQGIIADIATRHRLPAISAAADFAKDGGLMNYGVTANLVDDYRQAATYVDRILKGAKPSDLPVQAPTKYSFVINLKTAKALGLAVRFPLLRLADEVIDRVQPTQRELRRHRRARRHPASASASRSRSSGLVRKPSMPAARQASRSSASALAVSAMIGVRARAAARLRPRGCGASASIPSTPGMCTSISTRS